MCKIWQCNVKAVEENFSSFTDDTQKMVVMIANNITSN